MTKRNLVKHELIILYQNLEKHLCVRPTAICIDPRDFHRSQKIFTYCFKDCINVTNLETRPSGAMRVWTATSRMRLKSLLASSVRPSKGKSHKQKCQFFLYTWSKLMINLFCTQLSGILMLKFNSEDPDDQGSIPAPGRAEWRTFLSMVPRDLD